ncbi:unnamed protein product, partial [marine sediment metagenome]
RPCNPVDRIKIIDYAIKITEGLGLVIIDGIRDLCNDINCPVQATHVSTALLQWTSDYNIHVLAVLHQNKSDSMSRGHLGTELNNKAESVINVEKSREENNISNITCEMLRSIDFEPFAFEVNDNGLPYCTEYVKPTNPTGIMNITEDEHIKYVKEVFEIAEVQKWGQLIKNIGEVYGIGENKSREIKKYYMRNDLVKHDGNVYKISIENYS